MRASTVFNRLLDLRGISVLDVSFGAAAVSVDVGLRRRRLVCCQRVVADALDPARLDGVVSIGVDEVSWRRHHRYLTLATDTTGKKIIWGAPGKDTATMDAFFDELGTERSAQLEAVSMDMGAAFNKSVRAPGYAPTSPPCWTAGAPQPAAPGWPRS